MGKKLEVGDVCIFDKNNNLNLAGEKIAYVTIKAIKKGGLLNRDKYTVYISDKEGNCLNPEEMDVVGDLLTKLNPDEVVVFRYPEETPIINISEYNAMSRLYDKYMRHANDLDPDKITLAKLMLKLELFVKVIHEY
jgi:hypothetical protein